MSRAAFYEDFRLSSNTFPPRSTVFLPGDVGLLVVPPQRAEEEPSLIFTEDGFCLAIIVSPSSALETHLLSTFHREDRGPEG